MLLVEMVISFCTWYLSWMGASWFIDDLLKLPGFTGVIWKVLLAVAMVFSLCLLVFPEKRNSSK